jgi:signal transduction histidine kinase
MVTTGFAEAIADRIASEHTTLAARWFARLNDLLPVGADEVFPSDSLLDHIPSLILDISGYVRAPEVEAIVANTLVVGKARELGALRHQQRASLHQVLREYQLLGAILQRFVLDECARLLLSPTPTECIEVVARLHQAVGVLLQETVETFVDLYTRTITDQAERLRQFTRMATHEWRQPLAPLMTGVSLMRSTLLTQEQRAQTLDMMARNVANLVDMTGKLEGLARLDGNSDSPSLQRVTIGTVAQEAARQIRDMAEARGVDVRVAEAECEVVVDVGRLELALVNLLSNAIKYCDQSKPERYVAVDATGRQDGGCDVEIRDNGVGIAAEQVPLIFRRFSRAHADQAEFASVSGIGLGLAIVDDCVEALHGAITVESTEGVGTTFRITLPAAAASPMTPSPRAESHQL